MGRLSMSRLSMKTSLEVLKNKLDVAKGTATATVTANSDLEERCVVAASKWTHGNFEEIYADPA